MSDGEVAIAAEPAVVDLPAKEAMEPVEPDSCGTDEPVDVAKKVIQQIEVADAEEKETIKTTAHFLKGMILSVQGIPKEDVSMMLIEQFFKQFGDVTYVVYEAGSETALLRFSGKEDCARTAWEAALKEVGEGGMVVLEGAELSAIVLEGKEEEEYWHNTNKMAHGDATRLGGGRGRGGRGIRVGRARRSRGWARGGANGGLKREAADAPDSSQEKKSKKLVFDEE